MEERAKIKSSDTAGLETWLHLGLKCRVMLRRNLSLENGLVNGYLLIQYIAHINVPKFDFVQTIYLGAIGTIKQLIKDKERKRIFGLGIEFDHDNGVIHEVLQVTAEYMRGSFSIFTYTNSGNSQLFCNYTQKSRYNLHIK